MVGYTHFSKKCWDLFGIYEKKLFYVNKIADTLGPTSQAITLIVEIPYILIGLVTEKKFSSK